MINESFEEQMKHSLLFADSNLKSLFYGAPPTMTIPKKHSPGLGTDAVLDFKMDITPPLHLLPPITPPSSGLLAFNNLFWSVVNFQTEKRSLIAVNNWTKNSNGWCWKGKRRKTVPHSLIRHCWWLWTSVIRWMIVTSSNNQIRTSFLRTTAFLRYLLCFRSVRSTTTYMHHSIHNLTTKRIPTNVLTQQKRLSFWISFVKIYHSFH